MYLSISIIFLFTFMVIHLDLLSQSINVVHFDTVTFCSCDDKTQLILTLSVCVPRKQVNIGTFCSCANKSKLMLTFSVHVPTEQVNIGTFCLCANRTS